MIEESQYLKGYIAGYRDGHRDSSQGLGAKPIEEDIAYLPIQAMQVSTCARNCLAGIGCTCIADVAALDEKTIIRIRNLGSKTAAEVARWLYKQGICFSAWSRFL